MKNLKTLFLLCGIFFISIQTIAQGPFIGKPMYQVLTKRGGTALGTFTIELFPNIALKHVRNFDSLVSVKFYDSLAFHRVVPGFMIQGGGPNSKNGPMSTWGQVQPGQPTVQAEFSAAKHLRGTLSAARSSNINSATSQFFICVADYPSLNGNYSIYGKVTDGMNYVDTIVRTPVLSPPPSSYSTMPAQKIEMFITAIGSNNSIPVAATLNSPLNQTNNIDTLANLQLKWNNVSDAIIYHLDLSTDPLFIADTILSINTANLFVSKNNFKGNTTYYWRVQVNNGGHFSPYSQVWSFHTKGTITGLNSISNLKDTLLVYPNPSTGKFTFENLEKGSHFELFDPAGKLMEDFHCKENSMNLNMEKKEKGLYLCKITNNKGQVQTGKLLLQ